MKEPVKVPDSRADMSSMQEQRSEVRMLCADLVEVRWKDQAGRTQKAPAVLEDISSAGACLQLEAPVPLGITIRMRCATAKEFTGTVRYCVYREIGHFAGVEFHVTSRWSKKVYVPQHLLDMEKLLKQRVRNKLRVH